MRAAIAAILFGLLWTAALPAQQNAKSASPEAQLANQHYKRGWEAMRAESWAEAAREFQSALDTDPKFALAYYSLGRAEMGLRDFAKAIDAYTRCRDLYIARGGERYTDQFAANRAIDDRLLEYRTAMNQATQTGSVKAQSQSQSLYIRELQAQVDRLEQARQRNLSIPIDASVPYFVPMALGAAYFRSGQFENAEREYKIAIEANPNSGETHTNLAVLYMTTGRLDQADKEVALAEQTGFKVHPGLKDELKKKRSGS